MFDVINIYLKNVTIVPGLPYTMEKCSKGKAKSGKILLSSREKQDVIVITM